MVGFWLRLRSAGSLAHPWMWEAFFPSRGKEPKGDRWQPIRDSTMAAPGPLLAWVEGGASCGARLFASSRGRLGTPWVLCPSSAGGRAAPVGRPRCARGGGLLAAPDGAGFLCTSTDVRGVLSHSRERTKGRPVAAKSRQHHGCPRTPPRLAWGRSLVLCEAIGFLAGAAWNGWGCYAIRPLAAGRHRWAALVAREVVGLVAPVKRDAHATSGPDVAQISRRHAWPEEPE